MSFQVDIIEELQFELAGKAEAVDASTWAGIKAGLSSHAPGYAMVFLGVPVYRDAAPIGEPKFELSDQERGA